ncbi:MAG: c-type cytochrome [Stellaceae bacterium]
MSCPAASRAAFLVAALVLFVPGRGQAATGDPERGAKVYQRCMSCHSPDANKFGPMHRGVFGRQAGKLPDYHYSDALAGAGFAWDEAQLERWLTDPKALVPGTKMTFKLVDAQDRADVIAYLKTLK